MTDLNNSLPELGQLLEQRLAVVGTLAESLEASRFALGSNDAEAIARGAAHQAELCRQWSQLENELRLQGARRRTAQAHSATAGSPEETRSAQLASEWVALSARIRYLARVHWSLLRHMQRSLAVWNHVAASCAPTYAPARGLLEQDRPMRVGG
jgi:hypothetical protein